jgi:ParB family chromosome partitioning protein
MTMPKRKALGKGLSALIPDMQDLDKPEATYFQCPIEAIEANPDQPRQQFLREELRELVNSVQEKGIITPLLVTRKETGYQLIAGERRWRAAQQAGLKRVPVVVKETTATESLELAIIENIHRKDLNPIEEAVAYSKLLEQTGITQESLAKRLSKDRSSITNSLRLLNLPASIQNDVITGTLSMGHARLLAGIKDVAQQSFVRNSIIKKDLSVRQSEALVKKLRAPGKKNPENPEMDYYIQSLADNLKKSLGTKVEINKRGKTGKIVVHFYSDDELDRLLELIG